MDLQVCHCGWSKVTTFHGLRTHQGKKGCVQKGVGLPVNPKDFDLDVYTPVKNDYFPDMDLKKCFCGWSNVTTYHGLRTHQGKMGCTPKGLRIPESEQWYWSNQWKMNQMKHQPARKVTEKEPPSPDSRSISAEIIGTIKVEYKSPPQSSSQRATKSLDFSNHPQVFDRREMTGNWTNSSRNSATTASIKEEPRSPLAIPLRSSQIASKSGRQLQDFSTNVQVNRSVREDPIIPNRETVVRPKEKHRKDQTPSQVKSLVKERPRTTYPATVVPPKEHREEQTLTQGKELLRMSSATTAQERAVRPKVKHREEQKLLQNVPRTNLQTNSAAAAATRKKDSQSLFESAQPDFSSGMKMKELLRMFSATTTQETAVRQKKKHREEQKPLQVKHLVQPKEKDWEDPKPPQNVPDSTSGTTPINPASTEATTEEDPKVDFSTGMKVKELLRMFSATATQKTAVQPQRKPREEPKLSQRRSEAEWPEINDVFVEVVRVAEDAKRKSLDLSLSTLRTTASTMMEQIHQKLEKLTAVELKWISNFTVDVELDPTTAHRCLVSAYGKRVSNGGGNQETPGSVFGLNRFTSGKSYWEVDVSHNSGWTLGVARRNADHKGKLLSLNPRNGYWVTEHYKNKYAALAATSVRLSLKEKPQKVGVFVDYEEGLVSFYDVTAQSHIYSFTECGFTGEIYPYFILDGEIDEPLIISTVKQR